MLINDQPVSCAPNLGAIGGPCSGHLSLSHVVLIKPSTDGQMNSSPWLMQTWAASPGLGR